MGPGGDCTFARTRDISHNAGARSRVTALSAAASRSELECLEMMETIP